MDQLPSEVIQNIIPYTYEVQPKELRDDICSYYITQKKTIDFYTRVFNCKEDVYDWLTNDIFRFLNNDVPTMYGYRDFFLDVFKRQFLNHNKSSEDMIDCVSAFDNRSRYYPCSISEINMVIGLLNVCERNNLIEFLKMIHPRHIM